MTEFKIKRKRDVDRSFMIRLLFSFLLVVGALLTICIITNAQLLTYKHVIIFSLCSIPLCILYAIAVDKIGSVLVGILTGSTSGRMDLRERLAADVEKARHSKRNGRFEEALHIIDGVLDRDKEFPEALFLKAQILWDGFGRSAESKILLRMIRRLVPHDDPLYRWSSNYLEELMTEERGRFGK
jgi:hypothetical protein